MSDPTTFAVENLDRAKFECVFPTCGGICCQNGRPPVAPGERKRIASNLKRFLPHLRPSARAVVERAGFVTRRRKAGQPMLAVEGGWCVFFNDGCVLHKVGAAEGLRWKYKPWHCVVFPLARLSGKKWFVRQWKHRGEAWDLFCLNPEESPVQAGASLAAETDFARALDTRAEGWRGAGEAQLR